MATNLPCFGIWNDTQNVPPSAGNTLLGIWTQGDTPTVRFFCAFYVDANGAGVDPDESEWESITYHTRQGDEEHLWDVEIERPDYWAECRFLIPERR